MYFSQSDEAYLNGVLVGQPIEIARNVQGFHGQISVTEEHIALVHRLASEDVLVNLELKLQDSTVVRLRVRFVSFEYFSCGGTSIMTLAFLGLLIEFAEKAQSLCDRCCYLMRGTPSICNALHPTIGVDDCADFRER